jgi:hypothetical protein
MNGVNLYPLNVCGWVALDKVKKPGDDGSKNVSASVNVLLWEEHCL